MWTAIAEEDIPCTECYHTIPAGTDYLSQMPVPMPDGFSRRKYDNFCLECDECNANRRKSPCYVRYLGHWYAHKEKTAGPANCVNCGDAIPVAAKTVAQKLYVWPTPDTEPDSEIDTARHTSAAGGVAVGTATTHGAAGWHNLSRATQRRFMRGGLRQWMGRRSQTMAQRLYEKEVPLAIRNMGEPAVRDFLKGKHFSHVKSVANAPGIAKAPSNVVLEDAAANLSRGSRNMTSSARETARSAGRASAMRAGAKVAVKGGAKAGIFAAALEAVVSVPENILHYKRGRKSRKQAAQDIAKDTSIAAGVGVTTWGVTQGAAMVGFSPSLGPAAPALAAAGVGLMVGTAAYRIFKAAKRDLPLDEFRVYFCRKTRCRKKYAQQVTRAAIGRGERNYAWTIGIALAGLVTALIAVVAWLM